MGCCQAHSAPTTMEVNRHVTSPIVHPARWVVAGLACAVLLTGLARCTSDSEEPSSTPLPDASTGVATTLVAKPVPMQVRVTRLFGKLNKARRQSVERKIGATVSSYFDAAYLGGEYPRKDFDKAFATFSDGAARQARGDRSLLTNADLGQSLAAVVPVRKVARLSVLAPNKVAAGVTARIRLVFVADQEQAHDTKVTISGRLLLTRMKSGRWHIFGYDVARSSVPTGKGASR